MEKVQVFFINSEEFLKTMDKSYLLSFLDGKDFESKKRIEQFCLGRFLIKHVLEKFYDIKNLEIVIKNKKPCLKDGSVHFSLSHSENIVLCAFSSSPIGADVEFMKDRDIKKLLQRYNLTCETEDKEVFYKFWTEYEAAIKLQSKPHFFKSQKLFENYMLTLCTENSAFEDITLIEINTLNDR